MLLTYQSGGGALTFPPVAALPQVGGARDDVRGQGKNELHVGPLPKLLGELVGLALEESGVLRPAVRAKDPQRRDCGDSVRGCWHSATPRRAEGGVSRKEQKKPNVR